jgi:hypothetical protein
MRMGITGSLIPSGYLVDHFPSDFESEIRAAKRAAPLIGLVRWWRRITRALGPASGARSVLDVAVLPLLELLEYEVLHLEPSGDRFTGVVATRGVPVATLLVTGWVDAAAELPQFMPRLARTAGTRWALVCAGSQLHVADASRPWSRRTLAFDLEKVMTDETAALTMWALTRSAALDDFLGTVVRRSDTHALGVCASLGDGVLRSLAALVSAFDDARHRQRPKPTELFEQALTLVYRLLFLLFAEAHAVVPTWHRVYQNAYTVDALYRRSVDGRRARGLWDALQAISRLAHAGCRAGDLQVTAFNGRLFSPHHTPLVEQTRVADAVIRDTVLALATGPTPQGRKRIAYADLGVEQLGAVYEKVLEYEPRKIAGPLVLTRTSPERKATGSFYTPRSITEFLVRRTLFPLVHGRTSDEILSLRVLDPAMGSGAFVVAACRYLAGAAERARLASGEWRPEDATSPQRAELRRVVAQRCLYGVDLNPTAVQLARVSLWLTTLAVDRPLTFLDHHLASGDSLVGATLDDIARAPVTSSRSHTSFAAGLPLFEEATAADMAMRVLPDRFRIAEETDDTAAAVRTKERVLSGLSAPGTPLHRWKTAADLWCAGWLWPARGLTAGAYGDVLAAVLRRDATLPDRQAGALIQQATSIARRQRAFHWHLEFPEVFFDRDGRRQHDGGFDAVLGNPPWDVLRADTGSPSERAEARATWSERLRFFRSSGVYLLQGSGHTNQYQLFLERTLQLLRPGGRLGLIMPSGLATDHGSAHLRRALFDSVRVDRVLGFSNRNGIFPVHRDVRFLVMTGSNSGATDRLTCRFGLREAGWLDTLPDGVADDPTDARPIALSRAFLDRWDPEHLAIPELERAEDLEILAHVMDAVPRLDDARGWSARFGRELNATDDKRHFHPRGRADHDGLPVIEGKHIEPFRAHVTHAACVIDVDTAATLLRSAATFERARLGYRDVASATNRLTLIAAILPARTVSTHTIFCLKSELSVANQYCLLALFNSFVANYLVRLQVTTHVTASLMSRLPVPRPDGHSSEFRELASLARNLEHSGIEGKPAAYARLNAIAAQLYGLSRDQYAHVVSTFPLLPIELRQLCLDAHRKATETRRHRGTQ